MSPLITGFSELVRCLTFSSASNIESSDCILVSIVTMSVSLNIAPFLTPNNSTANLRQTCLCMSWVLLSTDVDVVTGETALGWVPSKAWTVQADLPGAYSSLVILTLAPWPYTDNFLWSASVAKNPVSIPSFFTPYKYQLP